MKKVIILDFGSQYTQLIARRVREQHIYCEIHPYNQADRHINADTQAVILSGSPASVTFHARPFGDSELLAVAKAYQDASGFHLKRPKMLA